VGNVGSSASVRSLAAAQWSGKVLWENAASKAVMQILCTHSTVSRDQVLTTLEEHLLNPDYEYRAPAIREAIARIAALPQSAI
jgi:hypothetical protein